MLVVASTGSCVGPQNKIGRNAHLYKQFMQIPVLSAREMYTGSKTFYCFFCGFVFRNCGYNFELWFEKEPCDKVPALSARGM